MGSDRNVEEWRRQLCLRQGEEEFRKHVPEFIEILGTDEDFASRLSSALGVEGSLAGHASPMAESAPSHGTMRKRRQVCLERVLLWDLRSCPRVSAVDSVVV